MPNDAFIYLEFLRNYLLPLPGVTEKKAYGTPAFYVGKKMFARIKEDGQTLVMACNRRDIWMEQNPEVFFITDHYLNYDYVLANMATANPDELKPVLIDAWRLRASATILKSNITG